MNNKNKTNNAIGFVVPLLALLLSPAMSQELPYNRLVVFGDSLSGDGSASSVAGCAVASPALYCDGRFTNGRVWPEYVADEVLGVELTNMACGGANTGEINPTSGASGLLRQVARFIAAEGGLLGPELALVLWAGSNDVFGIVDEGSIPAAVDRAISNIMQAVDALRDAGAARIVVANLPDLGLIPLADDSVFSLSPRALTDAAELFRSRLNEAVSARDDRVSVFDTLSAHRSVVANPGQAGLTNVTEGCLETGCEIQGASACSAKAATSGSAAQYLYWDSLHPTTKGHQIIADRIVSSVLLRLEGDWIGFYDRAKDRFRLDYSFKGRAAEVARRFPSPAGLRTALAGDWVGDGTQGIGLYSHQQGAVHLKLSNSSSSAELSYTVQGIGDWMLPIVGDWDGNGTETLGFYDPVKGLFQLKNSHNGDKPELRFRFGPKNKSFQPVSGDWNGDGEYNVGLYDPVKGMFRLLNSHRGGSADMVVRFGPRSYTRTAISGDWDGDGLTGIGLHVEELGKFALLDALKTKGSKRVVAFRFGPRNKSISPISGKWLDLPSR